ncbi:hypothetical protein QE152_g13785 [Popillia japonica]|uniref:Uncharacterized protein n=1 Tax=Popillia japonica TaxID=7064 RepID=A0AAW1L8W3_POPJA
MGTVTVTDENEDLQQKKSWRYKITKPCRCFIDALNFPLGCLLFTVVYWMIFIPIFYFCMDAACPDIYYNCKWNYQWKYLFWTFTSLAWVVIISAAICYWSCKYGREDEESELEQEQKKESDEKKEKDKLLGESVKYNNLKNEKLNLSIKNEKISPVKETTSDKNSITAKEESRIEKTTVTLPIRKSIIVTEEINIIESENKPSNEIAEKSQINQSEDRKPINLSEEKKKSPKQEAPQNGKPDESIMEEIDKMFPRCSMRRKADQRKRPDTLIIHSPKYPREEQELRRFTVQEHPKTTSPLTPREIFFQDLIQGAKRDIIERTENFLEHERKNTLDTNPKKPKVKDYILKSRSGTEASSPEYFIASVADRRSVTEAFIYVDGGQPQEALTICYIDQEDDVFKN